MMVLLYRTFGTILVHKQDNTSTAVADPHAEQTPPTNNKKKEKNRKVLSCKICPKPYLKHKIHENMFEFHKGWGI
jgi:hypothetical protein